MAPCSPGGWGGIFIPRVDKTVSDIFRGKEKRRGIEMENNEGKQENLSILELNIFR